MTTRKPATKAKQREARASAPAPYKAKPKELLEFYREMLLIRRFEERAGQMYGMGLIGGFCHLYIGQEAVITGVRSAMKDIDSLITAYRDHGHILSVGTNPNAVMAELTGRSGGVSKGKGGSMHMFDRKANFYGGHGIVGAQIPLGAGIAFAHKYKGDGGVSLTFFGDGAANQGQVYEAFNMAELWQLPVVFVIENNQYAMGTSVERSSSETHFYKRGTSFRIPGYEVDGMDVLAVRAAAEDAIGFVRDGNGPIILEMKTYRYRGHSMSDPAKYRTRDEVQKMRADHDPIDHLGEVLISTGAAKEDDLKAIDREIKDIISDAADFAQESPEPEAAELFTEVYA
ncbi:pyruvate dehydrogenase (acetyl-transferring) E1 component subunit alpha [Emcibacter sp. SYSU 3D8]|uniref:pyruvate dehydrogenase (acetyl-transferring) E1 component subunit alpha n=1 Tax=Emcibacter sp. SYSU 3D8 TaxID=3133969 RepID=UPI0031FF28C3